MDAEVTTTGPLFDGSADRILTDFTEDAASTVGDEGVEMVRRRLASVLKHPTGNYSSHINAVNHGTLSEVNDDDVIYGPWLEGTGSRNASSRFKGYSTFRKVRQELEAKAGDIAEREVLPQYMRRLNG